MRINLFLFIQLFLSSSIMTFAQDRIIQLDSTIISYDIGNECISIIKYTLYNNSTHNVWVWLSNDSINTSNKKKVRRRFFTKGEEHTNLLQIGLDVNATFDKDLFQNLIKVIKVGECFNLFFITNNQDNLKLSYSDILPHIVILDEYLVLKELHLSKNIFTPSFFYNSCSIIIPLEKFYQYIKKDLTEE
ncbi:hypothetical protein [Prevotella sp. HJM029]|uniref:hypothetical protein n=1 Tax=Prevotella sp. HJM029 TaxID=1433844 RepID=UPI0012DBEC04|nr:hypothetical protein [Prevotella sp. HJM029]